MARLDRGPYHAAFGAEGGAVNDGALGAGDEGYDGGHFLGLLEAFQQGTEAQSLKEFFSYLRGGYALLTGK